MASFEFRGVHVNLLPAGHGQYWATAYYANGAEVSVKITDMEWVDKLIFPGNYTKKEVQEAKRAIYNIILTKKKNGY